MQFVHNLLNDIKKNVFTKWVGFAIGFIAVILAIAQAAVYGGIGEGNYVASVVTFSILGAVLFLVLSVFKQTSSLAPLVLFLFEFLALLAFINSVFTTGLLDTITTDLFDGDFSVLTQKVYGKSAILMIVTIILSAVAVYVPQNSEWLYNKITAKANAKNNENVEAAN